MTKSIVKFPVVCPECGREALAAIPIAADALMECKSIRLHSNCHDKWWDASHVEVEQLRQYIGALSLAAPPQSVELEDGPQSSARY